MGSSLRIRTTWGRTWMPRQAAEADKVFQEMYGTTLEARFTADKYQLMHIEMFPHHIIHAECVGGEIDLLCNRRATIGFFPWRFVDGESCIGRCVAMVDDEEYEALMARKARLPKTRFGDGYDPGHVESIERLTRRF
jgi:arylformamidase